MYKRKTLLFLWICFVSTLSLGQEVAVTGDEMVLRSVTLISPERTSPLSDAWVAIRDGQIAAVGVGEPELDESWSDARVIDGGDRYLTPGLIDSHVHLQGVPGMPFPPPAELRPIAQTYNQQLPRSYLYFGFTTVIDLTAAEGPFLDRFRQAPAHPDVYHCGGSIPIANGYPMAFAPPEVRFQNVPNFLYDPRQADAIPDEFSPADHSPAAVVNRAADESGICVKTFWETGFGPLRGLPTPTHEMLEEIIEASRSRQLTVTMHANSFEAQEFATEVGVDAIVHGLWNWGELQSDTGLPNPIARVLDTIIANDIGYMPTMQVLEGERLVFDPEFLDDPMLALVLPEELVDWYRTEDGRWFADEMRSNIGGMSDERIMAMMEEGRTGFRRTVRYLAEHGARFLFGSDTPSAPTYANPPGYNGYLEMKQLVNAGVSLRQLLVAATIANAEAFNLGDRYGTIEVGKIANLLILEESPLESVEAWDTINAVVLHGKWIERDSLSVAH